MVSNGITYVLDCGLGVTNEYTRTGLSFHTLKSIFITHHHPDRNVEYGSLLPLGWVSSMHLDARVYGPHRSSR